MKRLLLTLTTAAVTALVAQPAAAQTFAPGPYYAMPSWDQTLPSATRFIVLTNWNNNAVLDRETGLVWERTPGSDLKDWFNATVHCMNRSYGTRLGWRVPSIEELTSLLDGSRSLPPGHPFTNVQPSKYWTATPVLINSTFQIGWDFGSQELFSESYLDSYYVWCVRGGSTAYWQVR